MKSAVLTTVSVFALVAAFAVPVLGSIEDVGIDMTTTASTPTTKGSRIAQDDSYEIAQADLPAKPVDAQASQTAATKTDDEATQPAVDQSALRFFARKGDKVRLAAEIARLRALHPDWTPPADPLVAPDMVDQQLAAMWKLYGEGKFDDIHKAIADRQAKEPGWQPPPDLAGKLAEADTRQKLVTASNAKDYKQVVDFAARVPDMLTCNDVDVLWRVADAFANTARLPRAVDAYDYILDNCTKQPERLATVMKASAQLDYGQMQTLLTKEKKAADGTGEFESIRSDLTRRFVGEGGINANLVVAPVYLDRLQKLVASEGKASDALLLGWYYVKRKDMTDANIYFRKAHDIEDTAISSQGLALTLIAFKKPGEAEDVMYKWRDTSKEAWATYFAATANLLAIQPPPVIRPEVLARVAEAVTARREIKTAENMGWYALAYQQPRTAAQWFRTTLGWKPDYEPAAYGLTIARLRLKDTAGVKQMQHLWGARSERIATILDPRRKNNTGDDGSVPSPDSIVSPLTDPGVDGYETQSIEPAQDIDTTITRSIRAPATVTGTTRRRPATQEMPSQETTSSVTITQVRAKGCGTSVDPATLNANAALNRGWCLMELNRPIEAAAAFDVALRSSAAQTRKDAAYGQSLAYLRAGLVDQAAVAATRAKQDVQRSVELQRSILSDRALNAFGAGRYRQTIIFLDQLAQLQSERSDLMVLRAFAYKEMGRRTEASRIFETLAATGNRDAIKALGEIRQEDEANAR